MTRFLLLATLATAAGAQPLVYLDLSGEWRQSADDQPAYAAPAWTTRV